MLLLNPGALWWYSHLAYSHKLKVVSDVIRAFNFMFFKAVLPPQAQLVEPIFLWHRGLAVVITEDVEFGRNVSIGHGVTIGGSFDGTKMRVEDDVIIAAHAMILPSRGSAITLGRGCRIGAGAIVTKTVAPGAVVTGPAATELRRSRPENL